MKKQEFAKKNRSSSDLIMSIALAGLFLALILILNFIFRPIKTPWSGGYSIQMFVVVYCLGMYTIQNKIVGIFFFLVVPPVLFFAKNGFIIPRHIVQVFIEYFLVYYVFGVFLFLRYLNQKINRKKNKVLEVFIITFFYIFCTLIRYLLHCLASYLYWNLTWQAALVFNAWAVLTNAAITVPFLIILSPTIFLISKKYNLINKNKY